MGKGGVELKQAITVRTERHSLSQSWSHPPKPGAGRWRQTDRYRPTDKERETERGAHSDTREDTRRGKRAVDRCGGSGSESGSGRGAGWLALDAERPDRGGRRDPSVSLARALPLLFSPILGGRRRFAGVPGRAHSPMGVQRVLVCSLERRTRSAPEGWAR